MLHQEEWPSWLYAVTQGATTIWERWDGWTHDKGFQDTGMNSFNHYAYGSIGEWLYSRVAGIDIDPDNPGYRHVRIAPLPGGKLTDVRASLRTVFGEVATAWTLVDSNFSLQVTVPANTTATVQLPDGSDAVEVGALRHGRHIRLRSRRAFIRSVAPFDRGRATMIRSMRRIWLVIEFVLLFVVLPYAMMRGWLYFVLDVMTHRGRVFVLLWGMALGCLAVLLMSPSFERKQLWGFQSLREQLPRILSVFLPVALLVLFVVVLVLPQVLFLFVRWKPVVWLIVMLLYPVLSVYPQSIIYRAFVFHRYRDLLPTPWLRIMASAAAFGFMHIVFENPVAPMLTFAGGLLFAYTYEKSRSLLASTVEHAFYGCWMFTVGLGLFFVYGRSEQVARLLEQ